MERTVGSSYPETDNCGNSSPTHPGLEGSQGNGVSGPQGLGPPRCPPKPSPLEVTQKPGLPLSSGVSSQRTASMGLGGWVGEGGAVNPGQSASSPGAVATPVEFFLCGWDFEGEQMCRY